MFFTKEDIQKIHDALLQYGVKDTQLPKTSTNNRDDSLVIVQDGINKNIKVIDFLSQISLFNKEAFINLTELTGRSYSTLDEAIHNVPYIRRCSGLVITYQDTNTNWQIYQFRGELNQFDTITFWVNLYDFTPYIVDSTLPDEEDLTISRIDNSGNNYMSLKDREYNKSEFSGKGYKILRKNIKKFDYKVITLTFSQLPTASGDVNFFINGSKVTVSIDSTIDDTLSKINTKLITAFSTALSSDYSVNKVEDSVINIKYETKIHNTYSYVSFHNTGINFVLNTEDYVLRKNILTQDMISESNTVYKIRYDFDLNGEEINIKDKCVLSFVGGSLSNGTINLQNNTIEAPKYKIFDLGIIVKNSSSIQTAFPEWYGAEGDGVSDDFQAFSKIFDAFDTISLSNKNYVIDCSIKEKVFYIEKYIHIKGDINTIVSFKNIADNSHIFHFDKNLFIEDVKFTNAEKNMKGICFHHLRTYGSEDKKYWGVSSGMNLQRCKFEYFDIAVKAVSYSNRFNLCEVEHCNIGFYSSGSIIDDKHTTITNNHFIQCDASYNKIGVHVDNCVYSVFDNCTSDLNGLSYDINEGDTIDFISCGMEYNDKLLRLKRCTTINFIGAWMLIKREGVLADFNKDYISLTNSDSIKFEGCKFKFSGTFDNDTEDSIPIIFSINGFYDWKKAAIIIDNTYVSNYYKGVSLLFDSTSKNRVLVLSNKGHTIANSKAELPIVDDSMSNVTGIEAYNLRSCQKNYFFRGQWRDCLGRTPVDIPFGVAASRPNYLQTVDSPYNTDFGYRYYDIEVKGPIYWVSDAWRDVLGVEITDTINLRTGISEKRKALSMPRNKSYGYLFYDYTLNKYVIWDGQKWVDMNGIDADVNKKGTSGQRPTLSSTDEGFQYYDTTLKKYIVWNGTEWTNMDGITL